MDRAFTRFSGTNRINRLSGRLTLLGALFLGWPVGSKIIATPLQRNNDLFTLIMLFGLPFVSLSLRQLASNRCLCLAVQYTRQAASAVTSSEEIGSSRALRHSMTGSAGVIPRHVNESPRLCGYGSQQA